MVEGSRVDILKSEHLVRISVSSVLGKNTKEYGKAHLTDGKEETCWNSDQGLPQHVTAKFSAPQCASSFAITSQGGFCPREIIVLLDDKEFARVEAQDVNHQQSFQLEGAPSF